jgi:hypothetical protein
MNILVYIFVPNQFVIGHVFLILLIKRLAVAMVNKTVGNNTDKYSLPRQEHRHRLIEPSMK